MGERYYQYTPLSCSPARREIRLLRLLPHMGSEPISCDLIHVSLDAASPYEALSYTWGPPVFEERILCNNAQLNITKSLHTALAHLRDEKEPRLIWADAVCINQNDTQEKNVQVGMMRDIYRNARKAVVWLGEGDFFSDAAMDLLHDLAREGDKQIQNNGYPSGIPLSIPPGDLPKYGLPTDQARVWDWLCDLIERPWFRRVWVIQEAAVSPEALLVCGSSTISWKDFHSAFQFFKQLNHSVWMFFKHPNAEHGVYGVGVIEEARHEIANHQQRALLYLATRHRKALASDPRDKIFALCGLSDQDQPGFQSIKVVPDYGAVARDVYIKFASDTIAGTGSLDIVGFPKGPLETESKVSNLPSWVPDWSVTPSATDFWEMRLGEEYVHYSATKETKARPEPVEIGTTLSVEGYIFDKLKVIGNTYNPDPRQHITPDNLDIISGWVEEMEHWFGWERLADARSGRKYVTGEDVFEAYWQTIIAGGLFGGYDQTRRRYLKWDNDVREFRFMHRLGLHRFRPVYGILFYMDMFARFIINNLGGGEMDQSFRPYLSVANQKRLAITEKGYFALAPGEAMEGDFVGLFRGSSMPLVVRRGVGNTWNVVSACYVHGLMHGEEFNEERCCKMWLS